MSFDPLFARDTILPTAHAACAVFRAPGAETALPAGYRRTGLPEADTDVRAAAP